MAAAPSEQVHMPSGGHGSALSLPSFSLVPSWSTLAVLIVSALVFEQVVYRNKKRHLPGDAFTIPIIGRFADSLKPSMDNYMRGWQFPLSAVSVFHIFIVMAARNDYTRRILNSPLYAEPCLTQSAKQILLPDNWVFLTGKMHVEFRKGLNCLFTRRALSSYLRTQDSIFRRYFRDWLATASAQPKPMQMSFRDLNMETSLRVFCGSYISPEGAAEISEQYWLITNALELVNFPLALPGTKTYKAIQARKLAMKWFVLAAAESKKRIGTGGEPNCLVDRWVKAMINSRESAAGKSAEDIDEDTKGVHIREFSDREIALVVMSFLFASQDAMTSGITFAFQHLATHPDVFAKVRAEQDQIRGTDTESAITLEQLDRMPYIRAVVKESLRLRPPVLMVPYLTRQAFPITEDYTVPAGTMLIPSFWNSLHDPAVYPEPDEFQPERWLEGGNAVTSDPKNYLVYGSGPHRCIGYEYANMHIAAVLGTAAMLMNWEHERTPQSEQISIMPTIFPKDMLRLRFSLRD